MMSTKNGWMVSMVNVSRALWARGRHRIAASASVVLPRLVLALLVAGVGMQEAKAGRIVAVEKVISVTAAAARGIANFTAAAWTWTKDNATKGWLVSEAYLAEAAAAAKSYYTIVKEFDYKPLFDDLVDWGNKLMILEWVGEKLENATDFFPAPPSRPPPMPILLPYFKPVNLINDLDLLMQTTKDLQVSNDRLAGALIEAAVNKATDVPQYDAQVVADTWKLTAAEMNVFVGYRTIITNPESDRIGPLGYSAEFANRLLNGCVGCRAPEVPEPSTFLLMSIGSSLVWLGLRRRR